MLLKKNIDFLQTHKKPSLLKKDFLLKDDIENFCISKNYKTYLQSFEKESNNIYEVNINNNFLNN